MNPADPETIIAQIKSHPGLVVLRAFDDDSPVLFWLLDMAGPELERWWLDREEFWWVLNYGDGEEGAKLAAIFGEDPKSQRAPMELPGIFLPGSFDHFDEDDLLFSLWSSLYKAKSHYYCHICCDADSFLLTPDGRRLHHKGYAGNKR